MPCPHFDVKIIQRSKRQSAVASAAYQSGERLFSEYDQKQKYYTGAILAALLILAAGGGAAVYFLVLKPKQGKKVPADLDDFDLEDEEEYLTEDEETEEKNE